MTTPLQTIKEELAINLGPLTFRGDLLVPEMASGLVIFAHGSGSGRLSPRNQFVAGVIRSRNIGTLLFDLLTEEEESIDMYTRHLRFDIPMLAERLVAVSKWTGEQEDTRHLRQGFFGASTGAGAALVAAAEIGSGIAAVVSRGGRPDLAGDALERVQAPVLLIIGESDEPVITMNEEAYEKLRSVKEIKIVPGATHLFEEPGTLEEAADLAADWFERNFSAGNKAWQSDGQSNMIHQ